VLIGLTFDSREAAEAFLTFLGELWQSTTVGQVLRDAPQARIAVVAESQQL
jgi:hypothetical protein